MLATPKSAPPMSGWDRRVARKQLETEIKLHLFGGGKEEGDLRDLDLADSNLEMALARIPAMEGIAITPYHGYQSPLL